VNDLVADTLEDARAAIDFLAKGAHGRARVLVLDRLPQGAPGATASVGQRALLDMARVDTRFEPVVRYLLSGWIASEGTLYGDGVLEGGSDTSRVRFLMPASGKPVPGNRILTAGLEAAHGSGSQGRRRRAPRRRFSVGIRSSRTRIRPSAGQYFRSSGGAVKNQGVLHEEEIRLIH
jgi:hypothetical protein